MNDTDSYLLKCTLEAIDNGVQTDKILKECECNLGLITCEDDDNNKINN